MEKPMLSPTAGRPRLHVRFQLLEWVQHPPVLLTGLWEAPLPRCFPPQGHRQGEAGKVAVPPVHLVPRGPFTGVW